jgi:hypothetical protein
MAILFGIILSISLLRLNLLRPLDHKTYQRQCTVPGLKPFRFLQAPCPTTIPTRWNMQGNIREIEESFLEKSLLVKFIKSRWFYVDRLGGVQSLRSEIGYGTPIRTSRVLLPSPLFITFSSIILYNLYNSKLSYPPSLYIYLPFPALGTGSLYVIRCSKPRFIA